MTSGHIVWVLAVFALAVRPGVTIHPIVEWRELTVESCIKPFFWGH